MRKFKYSLYSLLLALFLGGVAIFFTGNSPIQIYMAVLTGSLGSVKNFMNVMAYTIPLILTGLGACVAFTGGVFNIGGEGQLVVGGLGAVLVGLLIDAPAPFGIILALSASMLAGAVWALLPTLLVGKNLNTLAVGTIMMNSIGALLTEFIVKNFFQRVGASNIETDFILDGAVLPRFNPNTQFNYGIFIAFAFVFIVAWLLYKTPKGFAIRSIGQNRQAARQAGINVFQTTATVMIISGAIFGLAGGIQCLAIYKRFVMGFSPGYGWDGITVATLAGNSPFAVVITGFLFGMLRAASISMSLTNLVPADLVTVIQGLVVVFVATPMLWNTAINWFNQTKRTIRTRNHLWKPAGKEPKGGG